MFFLLHLVVEESQRASYVHLFVLLPSVATMSNILNGPLIVSGYYQLHVILSVISIFWFSSRSNPVLIIANSEDISIWETLRVCTDVTESLHQCNIFCCFHLRDNENTPGLLFSDESIFHMLEKRMEI